MCLNLGFDQSFSPRLDYGQPTTVLQSVKEPFHSGLLLNHQRSSSSSSSATVEHNHRVTIIDCVDYIIIQLWLQFFCERSIRYSLHINGFNGYAEIIIIIIPLDYYNRSHSSRPSSIASPRGIHHSPILYIDVGQSVIGQRGGPIVVESCFVWMHNNKQLQVGAPKWTTGIHLTKCSWFSSASLSMCCVAITIMDGNKCWENVS